MNDLETMLSKMSDHQILGLVEVMFEPEHQADDKTDLYVAAYVEAVDRELITEEE